MIKLNKIAPSVDPDGHPVMNFIIVKNVHLPLHFLSCILCNYLSIIRLFHGSLALQKPQVSDLFKGLLETQMAFVVWIIYYHVPHQNRGDL